MKFSINRETLLPTLQAINGVVERRQSLPILSNTLITADQDMLTFTATDMEIEILAQLPNPIDEKGQATIPARKLLDICRALPANAEIHLETDDNKTLLKSGKSRFSLSNLPVSEFPNLTDPAVHLSLELPGRALKGLIDATQFAMAHQDVRYYLNGLLLEFHPDRLVAVATDGHRLAMDHLDIGIDVSDTQQYILPRKGVLEIGKLLDDSDEPVSLSVSSNHIIVGNGNIRMTCKLVDGRFPDYQRVIPQASDKQLIADREALKQVFARTSILSNEKFRGIRMSLEAGLVKATAHNPEQEQAEEEVEVEYAGEPVEIGFNVNYLLDALSALDTEKVLIELSGPDSSALISPIGDTGNHARYVVMPMRL